MAIAITPQHVHHYVPIADRELPVDRQSVFHLRALTNDELAVLIDDADARLRNASVLVRAVKASLQGWERFCRADGSAVPFLQEAEATFALVPGRHIRPPTPATLDALPWDLVLELGGTVVRELNHVTRADAKN